MRPKRPEIPVITTLRRRGSVRSVWSPEDVCAFTQPHVDHRLDPVPHHLDLVVENFVVVVGIAGEPHRLAEVQPVLDRQRHHRQERRIRHERKRRHAQQARQRLDVDRRRLLLGADHRNRHDRRGHLQREPHEPRAELGQLIALRERLGDPARALGEHEHGFLEREQPAAVLRRAGDLAPAREQIRRERHGRHEVLDHRSDQARLRWFEEARRGDHQAIPGELAGVVGHEHHAPGCRDVIDAERVRAKVVAVHPARDADRTAQVIARQPERIEAELVAVDDERLRAAGDVVVGRGAGELFEAVEQTHARSVFVTSILVNRRGARSSPPCNTVLLARHPRRLQARDSARTGAGTPRAMPGDVRSWVFVVLAGCAPPRPPEPPRSEVDVIDPATFASKIGGLRATLARSHVELDREAVLRSCRGTDTLGCVRCDVATRADTAGVDPDMIDAVSIAFAHYPSKVLEAAHLEHVALCRQIRYEGRADDENPAGLAVLGDHRIMISIEHFATARMHDGFTIEQVVHHELFHALDYVALPGYYANDDEWRALNPPGFAYRDPAPLDGRRPGFVDAYATTNEKEDRASTFEYLIGQPAKLCELAKTDP